MLLRTGMLLGTGALLCCRTHAGTAAVGVLAVAVAVFAHMRALLVGPLVLAAIVIEAVLVALVAAGTLLITAALTAIGALVARTLFAVRITLHSAFAADQAMVAVVAAVRSSVRAIRIIGVVVIVRSVPVIDVPVVDVLVDDGLVNDALIDIGVVVVDNATSTSTAPVAAP